MAAGFALQSLRSAVASQWKNVQSLAASAREHVPACEAEANAWSALLDAAAEVPPVLRALLDADRSGVARSAQPGVWATSPCPPAPGLPCSVFYSPDGDRPLASAARVFLHTGFNGWERDAESVEQMAALSTPDSAEEAALPSDVREGLARGRRWFEHKLTLPLHAVCLDFVLSDGAQVWDNNGRADFHSLVEHAADRFSILRRSAAMEKLVAWRDECERAARADRARKAVRLERARSAKASALAHERAVLERAMRWLPAAPAAGEAVTLLYRPSVTPLAGKSEAWVRGGWNRWRHDPLKRSWGPLKLLPASGGLLGSAGLGGQAGWLAATVPTPSDAWSLDCVFSEGQHGGLFDNRSSLDYHVPLAGGVDAAGGAAAEPPLHLVHVSVEMAPIAKVGGLGDVVTSLGRAVAEMGHRVEVVLPKYDVLDYRMVKDMREERGFNWGGTHTKVYVGEVEGLTTVFLEPQNGFFSCGCIYGADAKPIPLTDAQRFGFFSHAALEWMLQSGRQPDVIHCHDWQTAPVARLYWESYRHFGMPSTRIVFSIHTMHYGERLIAEAVRYSQRVTTVSRTYAQEILGHGAIAPYRDKFRGVVNGIDPDIWDPNNDPLLPAFYDAASCRPGKASAKAALRARLGLSARDAPVVGVVTRLTSQKGTHLIKHAIYRTLERGGQVALLGSAPDPRVQREFDQLAEDLRRRFPGEAALVFKFDEPLSHLIYGGSDLMLVPSMFEPCGAVSCVLHLDVFTCLSYSLLRTRADAAHRAAVRHRAAGAPHGRPRRHRLRRGHGRGARGARGRGAQRLRVRGQRQRRHGLGAGARAGPLVRAAGRV
jgi:glycogen synthase